MCILFCCFKQKTAYEMRISDWSSDVCSSDLIASAGLGHLRGEAGRPCRWCGARVNDQLAAHSPRESVTAAAKYGVSRIGPREHQDHGCAAIENQIGRAACRERVCQYV